MVWNKPPPSTAETQEEMKALAILYQLQIISKEYVLDVFDIKDDGKTFFEGPMMQGPSHDITTKQANSEVKE
jgi:hypothetical protein